MDLTNAKFELRHPPKLEINMLITESAVMVAWAFVLYLFFG